MHNLTSFNALTSYIRPGDLVLLDIDETLVRPEPDATELWFVAFCNAMIAAGPPHKDSVFMAGVELWQALQGVCEVATPEVCTRQVLAAVAGIPGVTCIGLTARGPEVHDETVSQLRQCGVYDGIFETRSLGVLAPGAASDAPGVSPLTHKGGIIYCSGSRKPQGFFAFEASTRGAAPRPSRVVLVDDRESHVKALHEACLARKQPFLGLVYGSEADGFKAASSDVELARGWQLLARVLASKAGRTRVRRLCERIEGDFSEPSHTRQAVWPAPLAWVAAGVAMGFALGGLAVTMRHRVR